MIDRKELKNMAKGQLNGNIGALILCLAVYLVIVFVSMITIIGPLLIAPPLYFGLLKLFLGLTHGEKPQVEGIFEGFQIFGKSVLLWYAMNFFASLWALLLVVPGIIKKISYMFAPYILIENPKMSALDAISASKEMTRGHKMALFVLMLSFIPWMILGTVTFGIAYIYVLPYYQATVANAYNSLKTPVTDNSLGNDGRLSIGNSKLDEQRRQDVGY